MIGLLRKRRSNAKGVALAVAKKNVHKVETGNMTQHSNTFTKRSPDQENVPNPKRYKMGVYKIMTGKN
jgi:hypothetical protein